MTSDLPDDVTVVYGTPAPVIDFSGPTIEVRDYSGGITIETLTSGVRHYHDHTSSPLVTEAPSHTYVASGVNAYTPFVSNPAYGSMSIGDTYHTITPGPITLWFSEDDIINPCQETILEPKVVPPDPDEMYRLDLDDE